MTAPGQATPSFLRKMKNFMCNWEVSGASFSFDGKKVRLRVYPTGGIGAEAHPWKATLSGTELSVRQGTIDGILPSNIFSTLTIPDGSTRYITLNVSCTDSAPSSCTLSAETDAPVTSITLANTPPATFKDLIAVIADGTIHQIRDANLTATSQKVFDEPVSSPAPGEYNLVPYYRWVVGEVE